jgi:hypothetical protein
LKRKSAHFVGARPQRLKRPGLDEVLDQPAEGALDQGAPQGLVGGEAPGSDQRASEPLFVGLNAKLSEPPAPPPP